VAKCGGAPTSEYDRPHSVGDRKGRGLSTQRRGSLHAHRKGAVSIHAANVVKLRHILEVVLVTGTKLKESA
jgi:hypothetical protein